MLLHPFDRSIYYNCLPTFDIVSEGSQIYALFILLAILLVVVVVLNSRLPQYFCRRCRR